MGWAAEAQRTGNRGRRPIGGVEFLERGQRATSPPWSGERRKRRQREPLTHYRHIEKPRRKALSGCKYHLVSLYTYTHLEPSS